MKNILKLTTSIVLFGLLLFSLSSFTDEDESGGGGGCNLCVVKGYKKVLGVWVGETVFSCKKAANQSCSQSISTNDANGNPVSFSISCNNAAACTN